MRDPSPAILVEDEAANPPPSSSPPSSAESEQDKTAEAAAAAAPAAVARPSRQLWLGDIPPDTTEASLKETFSRYGNIERVSFSPYKSYAFVVYKNVEDAIAARAALQGKMRIDFAKAAKPSSHLWIGGIDQSIAKEQLEEEFRKFGMLKELRMTRDRSHAIAEYEKIESAVSAVETLNQKRIGNGELRVDFLRSHPLRKENGPILSSTHLDERLDIRPHLLTGRPNIVRVAPNVFSPPVDQNTFQTPAIQANSTNPGEEPSKVLWIGYPASLKVNEELLRRAFILFGDIEYIKLIPGRSFCFVQFRNVDEAHRAKVGLEGRLFNDPRVQIRFSNHEIAPFRKIQNVRGLLPLPDQPEPAMNPEWMGFRPPFGVYDAPRFASSSNISKFSPICKVPQNDLNTSRPFGPSAISSFNRGMPATHDFRNNPNNPSAHITFRGPGTPFVNSPIRDLGQTGRHAFDGSNLLNEDFRSRENKRLKMNETQFGIKEPHVDPCLGRGAFRGPQHLSNNETHFIGPGLFESYPNRSQCGIGIQGHNLSGPGLDPKSADKSRDFVMAGSRWKWQGVIAKAGTTVCRVFATPVSKEIQASFPEVVNCFARTDLDTLAKYCYPAADFGVISFVPDGDSETQRYQEFLCYLGGKHRAGVAKLDDGTTLFLVPPSDFSVNILQLHGSFLFGILLKLPQSGTQASGHQHLSAIQQQCEPKFPADGALTVPSNNQSASSGRANMSITPEAVLVSPKSSGHSQVPTAFGNSLQSRPLFLNKVSPVEVMHESRPLRGSHSVAGQDWPPGDSVSGSAFNGVAKSSTSNLVNCSQSTVQHTFSMTGHAFNAAIIPTGGFNVFAQEQNEKASQLPREELDQLITLLTQQERPSMHQAVQIGGHLPTQGIPLRPSQGLTPSVEHMQPNYVEPSSHPHGSSSASGQVSTESSVPVGSEGTWNSAVQHAGSLLLSEGNKDSEEEREKRFQATLKLAAALLQSIHKPQDSTLQMRRKEETRAR